MTLTVPTVPSVHSTTARYSAVAGPFHTIVVLAAIGAWAFGSKLLGVCLSNGS
jgi:hypothetical protein